MSNQALYLKWRPQDFEDVIGQDHITATLQNSLQQNRIRHAYLFSGPRGTGKTTTARLLAKAVGTRNFDLIEIDAASNTGVDDVRDLRDKVAFAPSEGDYKVYIIDEVHRFSGAAFDALLKTLEEPPAHVIFVLATTEIDKVPATIKSRCLLFEFRRVSVRQVVDRLRFICDQENVSIDDSALELIARQGTGSVRDSISLLDQVVADPNEHITLALAQHMLGAVGSQSVQDVVAAIFAQDTGAALDHLNAAIDMGADPRQFGQQVVDHLRNVMLVKVGGQDMVDASDEMRALLTEQASYVGRRTILKAVRKFSDAVGDMRGGWQPQLSLELAIVESTIPEDEPAPMIAAAPVPVVQPMSSSPPPAPKAAAPTQQAESAPNTKSESTPAPIEEQRLTVLHIQEQWQPMLQQVARQDRNAYAVLYQYCFPYKLEGTVATIAINHGNIIQRAERYLPLLNDTLAQIFQQSFTTQLEFLEDERFSALTAGTLTESDGLDNIASEFGGTISDLT